MKGFLPWFIGCLALVALIFAVWIGLILQDSGDINHWHRVTYEFDHSDDWLKKCQPQEVRMRWHQEIGWIDKLTIDLQTKKIEGSSGNGISFSAPFALVMGPGKPQGPVLTDDQVLLIKNALAELPAGENLKGVTDYSHDFRVAFYKDGIVQVRHYPSDHLPEPIARVGKALHLQMPLILPEQK